MIKMKIQKLRGSSGNEEELVEEMINYKMIKSIIILKRTQTEQKRQKVKEKILWQRILDNISGVDKKANKSM